VVKTTPTISPADQANGFAGGGLWSTPAYDPSTKYLYWGAGNPSSKDRQSPDTDAILKIDLDRSRSTFGQIVATYPGNVDQYASALQALTGVAIAEHALFVAAGGAGYASSTGYVVAYRAPGS
jgi:hypothetical protein